MKDEKTIGMVVAEAIPDGVVTWSTDGGYQAISMAEIPPLWYY